MTFFRGWRQTRVTKNLTISSNVSDYNAEFELGGPTGIVHVRLTIDSGVIVSASSIAVPALSTGDLVAGSTLRIINHGQIIGMGGIPGKGGDVDAVAPIFSLPGEPGLPAGPAMDIRIDVDLDNRDGDLFGGGGGGGGGGSGIVPGAVDCHSGGGGGGGAGAAVIAGAIAGIVGLCDFKTSGQPGGASTPTVAGVGGQGAVQHGSCIAGNGGSGGQYGQAGQKGADQVGCEQGSNGGLGGDAGKACELNGNTLTFIAGNNPTQVKGAVS